MEETVKTLLELFPQGKIDIKMSLQAQAVYDENSKWVSQDGPREFEVWVHFFPGRTQNGNKVEYADLGKSYDDVDRMLKGILESVQAETGEWDS